MSQTPTAPDHGQGEPVDPVQEGAPATGPDAPAPPVDSSVEDDAAETEDELEDEMSKQSFPTSDPPSTWAGDGDPSA